MRAAAAERLVRLPHTDPESEATAAAEGTPYIHPGGACLRGSELARVAAAEALGTALLVLLSPSPASVGPLHAGLVVALLLQCLGGVSGAQVNPVVSVMAWWCGRMRGVRLTAELTAQLTGALAGAAAHAALSSRPASALVTRLAPRYPVYKAVCVEAVCALCLALGNCAQWRGARADTWPLRAGALVAALVGFASDTTGGVMNPARSLGPALLAWRWDQHWVYWAGPLAGVLAACALQPALFPRPSRPAPPLAPPLATPAPDPHKTRSRSPSCGNVSSVRST